MHTLAFDGRTGASGDMILGALLDLGGDRSLLEPVETTLGIDYDIARTTRHHIGAMHVVVTRHGEPIENTDQTRSYAEVIARIDDMGLSQPVREKATDVFRRLGTAEAAVHDSTIDEIHFHEVGADDAIADIVGVAILLDDLDPAHIITTPIATGTGSLTMSHGSYPIPPPAVVTLAESASWEIYGGPIESELLTPTGAAILAQYASGVPSLPPMSIEGSGYGAGSREFAEHANVLRAIAGHTTGLVHDEITVLETNVDDVSPEILGGLHDSLLDAGARDVSIVPLTMKKSRPGHLVKVIVKPDDAHAVARRLAEETGTLGIRQTPATHRLIAHRHHAMVSVSIDGMEYEVAVKLATDTNGTLYDISAEYDDALAVASQTERPVREVMRRAEAVAWDTPEFLPDNSESSDGSPH